MKRKRKQVPDVDDVISLLNNVLRILENITEIKENKINRRVKPETGTEKKIFIILKESRFIV